MRNPSPRQPALIIVCFVLSAMSVFAGPEIQITIHADQVRHSVSRYLMGACIEDVNHEIYGGIDSQLIFGESFAEPADQLPIKDFAAFGGRWISESGDGIRVEGGDAPKLILTNLTTSPSKVSVEMWFADQSGGNGSLIVKVTEPGSGRDQFNGYEIALDPSGRLILGRHRQNWEPLQTVPCDVPINQWVNLTVRLNGNRLEALVDGRMMLDYEDSEHPLEQGTLGLRAWHRNVRFRNLVVSDDIKARNVAFALASDGWGEGVSGTWRAIRRGTAGGRLTLEDKNAFSGEHSQQIAFTSGTGEIGIENQSLNRWGMNFVKGKTYEGYIYVRAERSSEVFVALERRSGEKVYAEKRLKVSDTGWQRLDFTLKPDQSDQAGRFTIKLKRPGSVTVGYAFLQPGAWGRFKGLPVRKDVAEGLVDQGITMLRLGGCMANATEYRWKKMLGPRENRPPYAGWWYPHSSNGWGIFEFLDFCEAAGFLAVPDVNVNETPQDLADFIEYANGPADSEWGRKRAAASHPRPYDLKFLQIGNEEQVNENYWVKFKAIAEAIWAKDANLILVVGDFAYTQVIKDRFNFSGADGRITNLSAHQKILELAKQHDREVWFDVHVWTAGPKPNSSLAGMFSFIDALESVAAGAKHKVVVFELNANNHAQRRALANALALNAIERDGRLPMVASANCLQPDGQNDNGWDQGLLFLNPSKAWLQPPGYVTRMMSQHFQPLVVQSEVQNSGDGFDVTAKRSEDGKQLVLQVVNVSDESRTASIALTGFNPTARLAKVEVLPASLDAANTATATTHVTPRLMDWEHELARGRSRHQFLPHSFTVIQLR